MITEPEVQNLLMQCQIDASPWQTELLTELLNSKGPIYLGAGRRI